VPEALNLADDQRPARRAEALALLERLERGTPFPGPPRVGITGAPGAGKSTLLDALVRSLRGRGESVAIVAVDPSSRASGGALLGDRIRVRASSADPGVFVRSMASRDRLGGVSDAARAGVAIFAAADEPRLAAVRTLLDHVFAVHHDRRVRGQADGGRFGAMSAHVKEHCMLRRDVNELRGAVLATARKVQRALPKVFIVVAKWRRALGRILLIDRRDGVEWERFGDLPEVRNHTPRGRQIDLCFPFVVKR
jgi:hypothetical protein